MAKTITQRKPASSPAAAKRAKALAREAINTANRITSKVLESSRQLPITKPGALVKKRAVPRIKNELLADAVAPVARAVAPIGMRADVSSKLLQAAPAFGDVLRSIAHAVAVTQTALDDTALESLKTLSAQQVDVPVLIEQTLDDDGKPSSVAIQTASIPLTSIITPSMQQVEQMTLRMDMKVASFDATSGIKFNQNIASAGVSYSKGSFGFAVGMSNTNVNAQFSNMSDFASGSVMMSMDIVDRTGFEIPKPLEYGIGANLLVKLTSVTQSSSTTGTGATAVTLFTRTAKLSVKNVTEAGAVADLGGSLYTVAVPSGLTFLTSTGVVDITRICSAATEPYIERKIPVTFGQLTKEVTFYL